MTTPLANSAAAENASSTDRFNTLRITSWTVALLDAVAHQGDHGRMPTMQHHICDGIGCTAEAEYPTVTGAELCERCHAVRLSEEAACMAGNGTPGPLAGVSWWRRLLPRRR